MPKPVVYIFSAVSTAIAWLWGNGFDHKRFPELSYLAKTPLVDVDGFDGSDPVRKTVSPDVVLCDNSRSVRHHRSSKICAVCASARHYHTPHSIYCQPEPVIEVL